MNPVTNDYNYEVYGNVFHILSGEFHMDQIYSLPISIQFFFLLNQFSLTASILMYIYLHCDFCENIARQIMIFSLSWGVPNDMKNELPLSYGITYRWIYGRCHIGLFNDVLLI